MARPAYNHSRGDSPRTPCAECAAAQQEEAAAAAAAPQGAPGVVQSRSRQRRVAVMEAARAYAEKAKR